MDRAQRDDSLRDAQRKEFCDLYPMTSNEALKERFDLSSGTIQRWARELGVKKDLSYRREVQRKNAIGRVLSAEARAKIAAARQGRSWTPKQRVKTLQTRRERGVNRGERHYNWKGGRPWERFKKPEYLAWRNAVLDVMAMSARAVLANARNTSEVLRLIISSRTPYIRSCATNSLMV